LEAGVEEVVDFADAIVQAGGMGKGQYLIPVDFYLVADRALPASSELRRSWLERRRSRSRQPTSWSRTMNGKPILPVAGVLVLASVELVCAQMAGLPEGAQPYPATSGTATLTSFRTLGTLPDDVSGLARAVNSAGTAVGRSVAAPGTALQWRATWAPFGEGMVSLGLDVAGDATAINDEGVVVGAWWNGTRDEPEAYIWTHADGAAPLPSPGDGETEAYGVNGQGSVVGRALGCGSGLSEAVLWVGGSVRCLGEPGAPFTWAFAVTEAHVVVGLSEDPELGIRAVRWSAATGIQYLPTPEGWTSGAWDANDFGQAVGSLWDPSTGSSFPVLWEATGEPRLLPTPLGMEGSARGINGRGAAAGWIRDPSTDLSTAVVWLPDGTVLDLGAASGAAYSVATSISSGEFVGGIAGATPESSQAAVWKLELPPPALASTVARLRDAVEIYRIEGVLPASEALQLGRLLNHADPADQTLAAFRNAVGALVGSGGLRPAEARPLLSAVDVVRGVTP